MIRKRSASRFGGNCDGSAAIEFALVANAFFLLLIGTAYISIMVWQKANLDWAVQSGARLAVLNANVTQDQIATAVNTYLGSVGMGAATVQYSVATQSGVSVGQITASETEQFAVPLLSTFNITYTASADVPEP